MYNLPNIVNIYRTKRIKELTDRRILIKKNPAYVVFKFCRTRNRRNIGTNISAIILAKAQVNAIQKHYQNKSSNNIG